MAVGLTFEDPGVAPGELRVGARPQPEGDLQRGLAGGFGVGHVGGKTVGGGSNSGVERGGSDGDRTAPEADVHGRRARGIDADDDAVGCRRDVPGLGIAARRGADGGGDRGVDDLAEPGGDRRGRRQGAVGRWVRAGGFGQFAEQTADVDLGAPRRQRFVQPDPADGFQNCCRSDGYVADELWPGRQRAAHLE